jgi:hypothetical protein
VPFYYDKMALINIGKEYSEEVREDITLGKIAPQVGSELTYTDATNPNTLYPGTTWVQDTTYENSVLISGTSYVLTKWIRIA